MKQEKRTNKGPKDGPRDEGAAKQEGRKKKEHEMIRDPRFQRLHTDPRFARRPQHVEKVPLDDRFKHVLTDPRFNEAQMGAHRKRGEAKDNDDDSAATTGLQDYYQVENDQDSSHAQVPKHTESSNVETQQDMESRLEHLNALARGEQPVEEDDASSEDSALEMLSVGDNEDDISVSSAEMDDGLHRAAPLMEEAPNIDENVEEIDPTHRLAVVNCDWERFRSVDILATLQSFVPSSGAIRKVEVYPSEYGIKKLEEEARYGPVTLWETHKRIKKRSAATDQHQANQEQQESDIQDASEGQSHEDDGEIDPVVLRQYELNKLKYYYAIVHCDSPATANSIYKECNGLEWEHSANRIDLRFIPDDFEPTHASPRDTAEEIPSNYTPPEFYTKALQASNVELSWDKDDDTRQQVLRYEGAVPKEKRKKIRKQKKMRGQMDDSMEEDQVLGRRLQDDAYQSFIVDSDEADENDEEECSSDDNGEQEGTVPKKQNKAQLRRKYRALLLGQDAEEHSKKGSKKRKKKSGNKQETSANTEENMEITFTPGLGEKVLENKKEKEKQKDETVWEAYLRRKKEKRKERRSNAKQGKASERVEETQAKQEMLEADQNIPVNTANVSKDFEVPVDLQQEAEPADDPFFSVLSGESTSAPVSGFQEDQQHYHGKSPQQLKREQQSRQAEKQKQQQEKLKADENNRKSQSQLELLMMDDKPDDSGSESEGDRRNKKKKRGKLAKSNNDTTRDTNVDAARALGIISTDRHHEPDIDVKDPRFSAALENPEYQLDPTDPAYRDTEVTRQLIAEKHKRRREARKASRRLPEEVDTSAMADSLRKKFSKKR
eukprot:gb/GECG01007396.1/.p1 GENE.gb/GECG01007396.1/~~gb/GECG01007396.1/.p1  ORF type:complete len:834 (+),score=189.02 gb/GECG01007396.1/:1-2502(+)